MRRLVAGVAVLALVAVFAAVSGSGSQANAGAPRLAPTTAHPLAPVPSDATTCYVSVGRCSLQACTEYIGAGAAAVVRPPTVIVPAPRNDDHCRRFPAPLTATVVRSGPPVPISARPPTPNWTAPLAELRRHLLGGG